jgi:hypothetical protein
MTNEQIVAITAPMAFNGAIIGLMVLWMRAKFDAVDRRFESNDKRFESVDKRFESIDKRFDAFERNMNARFDAINQRFDDMKDLWRAELGRVEEILDARLKHLEQR